MQRYDDGSGTPGNVLRKGEEKSTERGSVGNTWKRSKRKKEEGRKRIMEGVYVQRGQLK